jgi:hypothetical protein
VTQGNRGLATQKAMAPSIRVASRDYDLRLCRGKLFLWINTKPRPHGAGRHTQGGLCRHRRQQ